ncbi:MAG TPA: DUF2505 domain-containing protein [Polyangiales bacterium]|nr:DUF2505 domain-containing protein [Polyangiales bacterium]
MAADDESKAQASGGAARSCPRDRAIAGGMKFSVEIVGRGAGLERIREIYFSQAFGDAVAKAANLVERKQVEHAQEPGGKERTRTHVVPSVGLPAPVQKLLKGHVISYDEIVIYDPASQSADFSIRSLAGKTVQVNGTIRFLEEPAAVRLRFEGEARIHVFGLGGMLERFLVREVTERYAAAQAVLQRFIDAPA